MYKNANKVLEHKNRHTKNMVARHSIASARLKHNISKVGHTISSHKTQVVDDVVLPPLLDEGQNEKNHAPVALLARSRNTMRREATSFSADDNNNKIDDSSSTGAPKRVLNHEKLLATMKKVIVAEKESVPEWEKRRSIALQSKGKGNRNISRTSQLSIVLLERKLIHAVKSLNKEVDSKSEVARLTNRMLQPHYKLADLKNFLHIFQSVDEDYSGDLDVEEWIKFFQTMNKTISQQQARVMFNKIDTNGDGFLSVCDLVPVVFSNASSEQKDNILKFLELELSKRKIVGKECIGEDDLRMLFESYDKDLLGFIKISFIREKVKSYALPDSAHVSVTSMLNDYDDDEMFNFADFKKLFQDYLAVV